MTKYIFYYFILLCTSTASSQNYVDPETPANTLPYNNSIGSNWSLDFSDEFNGTQVNTQKWTIDNSSTSRAARPEIGISTWFWKPQNVAIGNGNLILKVSKETSSKMFCGSINSMGKYETQYGYMEARIKIADTSKGTHTAFWLQGTNMGNIDGTGNDGAEVDIVESAWTGDYTKSVVHIDGYGASKQASTIQYTTPGIHTGYHIWGLYWTENFLKIYYDGVFKVQYTASKWIPRCKEYLWLSDGATFGLPAGDTGFTSQPLGFLTEAYVDYIRVWKPSDVTATNEISQNTLKVETQNTNIKLSSVSTISSISLFNSSGKNIYNNNLKDISHSFDVKDAGIYLLSAKLDNGEVYKSKIIIYQEISNQKLFKL